MPIELRPACASRSSEPDNDLIWLSQVLLPSRYGIMPNPRASAFSSCAPGSQPAAVAPPRPPAMPEATRPVSVRLAIREVERLQVRAHVVSGTVAGIARELIVTGLAGGDNKALADRLLLIERRLVVLEGLARDRRRTRGAHRGPGPRAAHQVRCPAQRADLRRWSGAMTRQTQARVARRRRGRLRRSALDQRARHQLVSADLDVAGRAQRILSAGRCPRVHGRSPVLEPRRPDQLGSLASLRSHPPRATGLGRIRLALLGADRRRRLDTAGAVRVRVRDAVRPPATSRAARASAADR